MQYIFADRKRGAIAHPDNYREVEQWTENPCVRVPIAIGTIPRTNESRTVLSGNIYIHFFCYIIYSKSIDRYYTGYTSDIIERLKLHNSGHFGGKSYTNRTNDWEIYLLISCKTIEQAVYMESRIKKMKSSKYIENLKKYPEMVEKIMKDYNK